jgi:flavin-dependent dehydrogenase
MYTTVYINFEILSLNMGQERKKIAIIGAGIAGCTCALELSKYHDVEIFEAADKDAPSRPLQMEGAVYYLDNIPKLKPTYKISELILASENQSATFRGDLGYLFRIGGINGVDVQYRKEVEKRIKINYSSKITSLDMLSDYDVIVAADGHRSRITQMAGMRYDEAELKGLGLGLTVKGHFRPGYTYSLFDNTYAPGGYLYLIPINRKEASLVSASIGCAFNSKHLRKNLRNYAHFMNMEIVNEWTDIEKWYKFKTYEKDNIFVIGGAASFTDKTYGFGLKYSILSAKLCAEAIFKNKSYQKLLKPVLRELDFWDKISRVLVNTSNREKDLFIKMANNYFVKRKIESGRSLRSYFRLLSAYFKMKNIMNKEYSPSFQIHSNRKIKFPIPER